MGKTERVLKQLKAKETRTPIGTDLYLPNHSGISTHPEVTNNFVPYSGATKDVDLGTKNLSGSKIILKAGTGSGATANNAADNLVINSSDDAGISILTPNNKIGYIIFGDPEDVDVGILGYVHSTDTLNWRTGGVTKMQVIPTGMNVLGNLYVDSTISGSTLLINGAGSFGTQVDINTNFIFGNLGSFLAAGNSVVARTDGTGSAPFNQAGSLIYKTRVTGVSGRSSHHFYTGDPSLIRMHISETGVITLSGSALIKGMKSGATQAGAGASAYELWKTASHATLPDNVIMIGA